MTTSAEKPAGTGEGIQNKLCGRRVHYADHKTDHFVRGKVLTHAGPNQRAYNLLKGSPFNISRALGQVKAL
jgi:hypothetical protein